MLKDILIKAGDFCFKFRTMQYIPYVLVVLLELEDFRRVTESIPYELFCFSVTLFGLLIRILTVAYVPEGTSGRNRNEQIAETLNTSGMYSIVRNPLYVGNFFVFLGLTLLSQSWEIIAANSALMILFYTVIVLKEEDFLSQKFGEEYKEWTQKVNCFIPSFKNYKKSDRKFSIKKVVKNEHDTWLTALICFTLIEVVRGYFEVKTFFLAPLWIIIFACVFVIWLVSKILKKTSSLN